MKTDKENYLPGKSSRREMTPMEILVMVMKGLMKITLKIVLIPVKISIWVIQVLIMTFMMLTVQNKFRNRKK